MNTNRIRTLMTGAVLSCLMMPLSGFAHEPVAGTKNSAYESGNSIGEGDHEQNE